MSQVAYVDLSKREFSCRHIPEELLRLYLGGRGLNAYLLFNHLRPGTDPLSPDNVLIFGSGMLNGHLDVSNGRWHVTGKSPETGINGDSNAGGFWGAELKQAGFQHLVIKGKASMPTYLWIHDGEIEFRDASFLWGRDTHETQELIMDELGDPHVQIACIGQAGEQLVRFACVRHGIKRAAGRTGMGCIMGCKMLKAIAVRGTLGLTAKNPNALLQFAASHYKKLISTKQYPIFSRYGTLVIFAMTNEMGLLGAYNHQYNHFEVAEGELEAEIFDERYKVG
ncbi:MAG: aldehyde ferredoxin oxidoreductase N-terminal domain-containing protein, partial [Desulfobacteraceae bacterium]